MENIIINDKDNKRIMYAFGNPYSKIYTYNYVNGRMQYISNLNDFLAIFRLSNNNKLISIGIVYKVYLDLDSGYLHYFKNGVEDYIALNN